MGDTFRASEISLKVQKKLLSKMSNKNIAKNFVDDNYANILDNLYNLAKAYTGNKKDSEKNDQFSEEDLQIGHKLRNKFSTIVKTVISFFEVEFSFDKNFLVKNIEDCRGLLKQLVGSHLTDKSIQRIDHVLNFFSDSSFLEEMFKKDSVHRPTLQAIIDDMNKAVDAGEI